MHISWIPDITMWAAVPCSPTGSHILLLSKERSSLFSPWGSWWVSNICYNDTPLEVVHGHFPTEKNTLENVHKPVLYGEKLRKPSLVWPYEWTESVFFLQRTGKRIEIQLNSTWVIWSILKPLFISSTMCPSVCLWTTVWLLQLQMQTLLPTMPSLTTMGEQGTSVPVVFSVFSVLQLFFTYVLS